MGWDIRRFAQCSEQQLPWLSCPSDPSAVPSAKQWYWTFSGRVTTATTSYKGVYGRFRDIARGCDGTRSTTLSLSPDLGSPDCHNTVDCNGLLWRANYFVSDLDPQDRGRHQQDVHGRRVCRRAGLSLGRVLRRRRLGDLRQSAQYFISSRRTRTMIKIRRIGSGRRPAASRACIRAGLSS